MLIPQFSLRWLLAITTIAALVFSIVALAVHGSRWAEAVSIGMFALVLLAVIHVVFFVVVWSISTAAQRRRSGRTPFQETP
jgi:hypothetical protein